LILSPDRILGVKIDDNLLCDYTSALQENSKDSSRFTRLLQHRPQIGMRAQFQPSILDHRLLAIDQLPALARQ